MQQQQRATIVNLTSVDVTIILRHSEGGFDSMVFPKTGVVASVTEKKTACDDINGIPSIKIEYGAVENLPPPEEGTLYIVAMPVGLNHKSGRTDLIGPNTGAAIREQGTNRIIGCPDFVRY